MHLKRTSTSLLTTLLTPLLLTATAVADPPPDGLPTITIDDNAPPAPESLPPLLGVNKAPWIVDGASTYDVSQLYAALGITSVRTHDGPFDPCKVYLGSTVQLNTSPPGTNCNPATAASDTVTWTANTASYPLTCAPGVPCAGSYDWTQVDAALATIAAAGAEAYVRVGESWNGTNKITGTAQASYATVAGHLVERIAAAVTIDRAEIWNEPEVNGRFWKGTRPQFYNLYARLVQHATAPLGLTTGGAGFTQGAAEAWTDGLIANWATDADPDGDAFVSAHHYGDCSTATEKELVGWLDTVRANMASDGLTNKSLHVTEWNISTLGSGGNECSAFGTAAHGSYVAAALLLMSQPDFYIRRSHFYGGIGNGPSALFSPSGNNVTMSPAAWGFWGYGAIAERDRIPTLQSWSTGSGTPADAARAGQRWFGQFARDPSTGGEFLEIINDQASAMTVLVMVNAGPTTATRRQKSGLATTSVPAGTSPSHVVTAANAAAALTVPGVAVSWTTWGSLAWMTVNLPANSITTLAW